MEELVNSSAFHAGDFGFESRMLYKKFDYMKQKLFKKGKILISGWLLIVAFGIIFFIRPSLIIQDGWCRMVAITAFCLGVLLLLIGGFPLPGYNRCQPLWILKISCEEYPRGKMLAVFNCKPSVDDILSLRTNDNQKFFPDSKKDCAYLVRDQKLHGFSDEVWELVNISTSNCLTGNCDV